MPLRVFCPGPLLRLVCSGGGGPVPVPPYLPWPARPVGPACRRGGGGPSPGGGWPATVVRGVWCQALSLPRPPVLWGGQPGYRDPCVPGAVGAGVGSQHRPHSVRPSGPALLAVGVAEGRPRAECLPPLRGASGVRRCPSPDCPPTGRAVGVRHPHAVNAGVWVWGPIAAPLACMPCGGCVPRGWRGAVPGGVACHCCQGRLVSGAVPPPAARPLGWAAGVPRPVCPGCGRCGRGDPAQAPQRAPLRAGVARCGGGRRASPGGGAFHRCEGRLRSGAPPPAGCRPTGRAVGVRYPRVVAAGVWVWGPNTVLLACTPCGGCVPRGWWGAVPGGGWPAAVVRGVWCQALSLPRPSVL